MWRTTGAALIFMLCTGMTDCCGTGGPELMAYAPDNECTLYDCGVVVGGELLAHLWTGGGATEEITIEPADIADVVVDGELITIKPRRAGAAKLTIGFTGSEYSLEVPIEGTALATTEVLPDRSIAGFQRVYPPGPKQMFQTSKLRVIAAHRDANGKRLLGHGYEAWSMTGGTSLDPVPDDGWFLDTALVRDVVAGTEPRLSISAGPGSTPLELDVLPAGSTTTLELAYKTSNVRFGELTLRAGEYVRVPVHAFSADGRFIHGVPPGGQLVATLADETLAEVSGNTTGRALTFFGLAPGRTELDVTFDGVSQRFTLVVY